MYFPYSFWSNPNLFQDLVAFYTFNDSSNPGKDSLNTYNLTENGAINTVVGKINNAANSNDDSSYLSISDTTKAFNFNTNKTYCFWIKIGNTATAHDFMAKFVSPEPHFLFQYSTIGNSLGIIFYDDAFGQLFSISTTAISQDVWYFVALTHNATTKIVSLALNNNPDTTFVFDYTGSNLSNPQNVFKLFEDTNGPQASRNATIDSFGIWNRVLNESELSFLYNNGNGVNQPF